MSLRPAEAGNDVGEAHKKCVEQGQAIVFVYETDKSIHSISNADPVKQVRDSVGRKVTIDGTVKDAVESTPTP